ncbi:hypothetical protein BX600DRAFT_429687 [Xylariales sp. PMI_506]|nr:hypothetical protein BX600DRAFT_429687 [Xylariales sp. PMI_506]
MLGYKTLTAALLVLGAYAELEGAYPGKSVLLARQSSISLTPANESTAMNYTQWDTQTAAACDAALAQLSAASNPSGTSVCYNIPSLDTSSGAFMADLRLYQISSPTGSFANIEAQNIQVELQYHGASVSIVNMSTVTKRSITRRSSPTELQVYMFVGQIDSSQMSQTMTMGVLEALIMPTVSLKGVDAAGTIATTNVSMNEASFVSGIFADDTVLSDTAKAQLALDSEIAGLANGTVAFVLPGVNILIFPVGLIVTGFWTVVGVSAYAFGTFQRMGYAESFRQRKMRAGKSSAGRI